MSYTEQMHHRAMVYAAELVRAGVSASVASAIASDAVKRGER